MKICFLAHGVSIHTRKWARYFRDQGHQVSLVTLTPDEPMPGMEIYDLKHCWHVSYENTNWHYLLKLPRLWKVVRDIKPDILIAIFLSSYGMLGALVRLKRSPLVIRVCGSDIFVFPKLSFIHSLLTRFALSRADLVISVAQHMTQTLSDYMAADKPVLTQQYGIDTNQFFPPHEAVSSRAPVCLSNRAMVPICNLETILLAACKLEAQGSPLHINLAGHGEQFNLLKQKADALKLRDRVSFVGHIDHVRMPEELQAASIYISMSLSDGTSISLMEAMACGAFPVVSDIPANREWITDGVNGYLVSPHSPDQLAQRLNDAWNRHELRKRAAERNWSIIREKGDYKKNMAIIESAFLPLTEQSKGKR